MSATSASSRKRLALLHSLAFVLMIVLNVLAVTLPLNGKSTGQLSDQYPNLFTPAGLTFSIWSVIYSFLLGFIIYQFIVLFKANHPATDKVMRISKPFLLNAVANAGWIVAWHYEQLILSVCVMLVILATLITIHERLRLALPFKPLAQKLWLDIPFSLYLGWISIATIANITALLVNYDWNGFGISPYTWTVIMISIGTLLNMWLVLGRGNIAFGLVGIWAFTGIILKRQAVDGEATNNVILSAQLGISLIIPVLLIHLFRQWKIIYHPESFLTSSEHQHRESAE